MCETAEKRQRAFSPGTGKWLEFDCQDGSGITMAGAKNLVTYRVRKTCAVIDFGPVREAYDCTWERVQDFQEEGAVNSGDCGIFGVFAQFEDYVGRGHGPWWETGDYDDKSFNR